MNTKVTVLATILAIALVFAAISPAEAKKAINDNLSPKSYGIKTNYKISVEKTYPDNSEPKKSFVKSEQLKTKLKQLEVQKALEFVKKTYRT